MTFFHLFGSQIHLRH